MSQKSTVKTVSMVMVIVLFGKLSGMYREMLVAMKYGTESMESNAFAFASQIPRTFLDVMFASAISASFIPIFNAYLENKGKKEAFKLANTFITLILLASLVVTALCMVFSGQLSEIGHGLDADTKALTGNLLLIMLPTIFLSGIAFSLTGVLQSLGEFNIPAAMSLLSNVLIIVYCLFFVDAFGIYGLAAVFLLGWATQILIQIPSLIKRGYFFKFDFSFKTDGIRQIGRLSLPVLISTWVTPVNVLVNTSVASVLFVGAVPALTFANGLYSVITGVFVLSVANVMFTQFSRLSAQADSEGLNAALLQSLRVCVFFLLPLTVGLIILSQPLIRLIYEYGEFSAGSTAATAKAMIFYSTGILGFGLQTILNRRFYAVKKGKLPMISGICAIAVNAGLSFALAGVLDVGGPALASSVSLTTASAIMLFVLARDEKKLFSRKFFYDLLKMACSTVIMTAVVLAATIAVSPLEDSLVTRIIQVAAPAASGVVSYMLSTRLFAVDEAVYAFKTLKKIFKR